MKKIYLFIALPVLCYLPVNAQPTLTGANTNPTIGQSFTDQMVNWQSQGNSGANVTWNFSSLSSTGTSTLTWIDPATTPYNSNFTGANLANGTGSSDAYYTANSSSYSLIGIYSISDR